MPSRSGRLCQPDKLFSGLGNAGIAAVRLDIQTFGIDKCHFANAHQTQYRTEIGGDGIAILPAMYAAAGADHHRAYTLDQPLMPALGVAEGFAGPGDQIKLQAHPAPATLPELAGHQTIGYLLAGLPQAIRQTVGQQ